MKKLLEMLSYMRPAGSPAEADFIRRYIQSYKPVRMCDNLFVTVPGDDSTLFSCHTDTVHRTSGRQQVIYDAELGIAYKDDEDPLGGDDTCGVWILLEMIKAQIPGTYAFHYGEERGCIGSHAMAKENEKWLAQFDRAIAFDRRGTTSVITHQRGDRCCSGLFAAALAQQLGTDWKLDDTGIYTDTASYMDIIPECTNLSVGYQNEHTPDEQVDVHHLLALAETVKTVQWSTLPTKRDPSVHERKVFSLAGWEPGLEYAPLYEDDFADFTFQEMDAYQQTARLEVATFGDALYLIENDPENAAAMLLAFVLDAVTDVSEHNPLAETETA